MPHVRVCAAVLFASLCLAQETGPQAVQDEKIRELERRITAAEATRIVVDINSNRITRIETSQEANQWWLTGLMIPIALLAAKAIFDLIPKSKNGDLAERVRRLENGRTP